jgi:hypothetical protein
MCSRCGAGSRGPLGAGAARARGAARAVPRRGAPGAPAGCLTLPRQRLPPGAGTKLSRRTQGARANQRLQRAGAELLAAAVAAARLRHPAPHPARGRDRLTGSNLQFKAARDQTQPAQPPFRAPARPNRVFPPARPWPQKPLTPPQRQRQWRAPSSRARSGSSSRRRRRWWGGLARPSLPATSAALSSASLRSPSPAPATSSTLVRAPRGDGPRSGTGRAEARRLPRVARGARRRSGCRAPPARAAAAAQAGGAALSPPTAPRPLPLPCRRQQQHLARQERVRPQLAGADGQELPVPAAGVQHSLDRCVREGRRAGGVRREPLCCRVARRARQQGRCLAAPPPTPPPAPRPSAATTCCVLQCAGHLLAQPTDVVKSKKL